jgi:hypothetical protein
LVSVFAFCQLKAAGLGSARTRRKRPVSRRPSRERQGRTCARRKPEGRAAGTGIIRARFSPQTEHLSRFSARAIVVTVPVILHREDEARWLEAETTDAYWRRRSRVR